MSKSIFRMSFIGLLILTSCHEVEELRAWVNQMESLRNQVRSFMDEVPYQEKQHQAFKNYFSEIEKLALKLVKDPTYARDFNRAVASVDLADLCARVFVNRLDWESLIERCTRNSFFLCSDEVRFYPDLIGAMRKTLSPDQQQRFDAAETCLSSADL